MSPEVLKGRAYTAKTDCWAAGCVLYELCCLRKAFDANNIGAITVKVIRRVAFTNDASCLPCHCAVACRIHNETVC